MTAEPTPYEGPEPWARAAWEADLPATPPPVAAKDHVTFLQSATHPGVVWPL